jgi:hypothetical protein
MGAPDGGKRAVAPPISIHKSNQSRADAEYPARLDSLVLAYDTANFNQ